MRAIRILFQNLGDSSFDDRTYQAGLGINTRLLGWGVSFMDIDNDGWLDILVANGHVYPEVDGTQVDAAYAERKYLYRNLRNGQFEDVSLIGGKGITTDVKARGFAIGDFDNDGDLDAVVNCVNAVPQLLTLRFDAESELDQDSTGGDKEQSHRHRRAHQSSGADGHAAAERETWFAIDADRRSSVVQWVLLGE